MLGLPSLTGWGAFPNYTDRPLNNEGAKMRGLIYFKKMLENFEYKISR
jgi:hypothetical protein